MMPPASVAYYVWWTDSLGHTTHICTLAPADVREHVRAWAMDDYDRNVEYVDGYPAPWNSERTIQWSFLGSLRYIRESISGGGGTFGILKVDDGVIRGLTFGMQHPV